MQKNKHFVYAVLCSEQYMGGKDFEPNRAQLDVFSWELCFPGHKKQGFDLYRYFVLVVVFKKFPKTAVRTDLEVESYYILLPQEVKTVVTIILYNEEDICTNNWGPEWYVCIGERYN